jgi:hypothetical protein
MPEEEEEEEEGNAQMETMRLPDDHVHAQPILAAH